MKNFSYAILILLMILPVFVFAATPALEEGLNTAAQSSGLSTQDEASKDASLLLSARVGYILQAFFMLLGVVFLGLVILGGYYWMMAGGELDKVKKGKKYLINAIVGLIILSLAYSLTSYIITKIMAIG